jgi:hypothetical protein
MIIPRHVLGRGFVAPSDRLLIASIGIGGKDNRTLLCFIKAGRLILVSSVILGELLNSKCISKAFIKIGEMFDKEHKNFDAVSVATQIIIMLFKPWQRCN